jgi:hypothetical protein
MFSHLTYILDVYVLSFSIWMIVGDKIRSEWRRWVKDTQLCLFFVVDRTNRSVRYKLTKKTVERENDDNRGQGGEEFSFDTLSVIFKEIHRRTDDLFSFFSLLLGLISTASATLSVLKVLPNGSKQANTTRFCLCWQRSIAICIPLIARIALRYVIPIVDDEIVIGSIYVFGDDLFVASWTYLSIRSRELILENNICIHANE